jgi:hypothetical protein
MADIPNLAGIATADLVEKIGGGNFQASYINWSRTLHLLRTHAPGWLPEIVNAPNGGILHEAPQGAFLLLRFRHTDGTTTPEVPQAVMDPRNAAIPFAKVTARDITDTHRRGVCMAAALTFGLAYELWAKVALESGYHEETEEKPKGGEVLKIKPTDGAWEAMDADQRIGLQKIAADVADILTDTSEPDKNTREAAAFVRIERERLDTDEKAALWTLLDSKYRSALKRAAANHAAHQQKEAA